MTGKYNGSEIEEKDDPLERINCWLRHAYAIDDIIESKSAQYMKTRIETTKNNLIY